MIVPDLSVLRTGESMARIERPEGTVLGVSVLALADGLDHLGYRRIPEVLADLESQDAQLIGITGDDFVRVARFARKHKLSIGNAHAALLAQDFGDEGHLITHDPGMYTGIGGLNVKKVKKVE